MGHCITAGIAGICIYNRPTCRRNTSSFKSFIDGSRGIDYHWHTCCCEGCDNTPFTGFVGGRADGAEVDIIVGGGSQAGERMGRTSQVLHQSAFGLDVEAGDTIFNFIGSSIGAGLPGDDALSSGRSDGWMRAVGGEARLTGNEHKAVAQASFCHTGINNIVVVVGDGEVVLTILVTTIPLPTVLIGGAGAEIDGGFTGGTAAQRNRLLEGAVDIEVDGVTLPTVAIVVAHGNGVGAGADARRGEGGGANPFGHLVGGAAMGAQVDIVGGGRSQALKGGGGAGEAVHRSAGRGGVEARGTPEDVIRGGIGRSSPSDHTLGSDFGCSRIGAGGDVLAGGSQGKAIVVDTAIGSEDQRHGAILAVHVDITIAIEGSQNETGGAVAVVDGKAVAAALGVVGTHQADALAGGGGSDHEGLVGAIAIGAVSAAIVEDHGVAGGEGGLVAHVDNRTGHEAAHLGPGRGGAATDGADRPIVGGEVGEAREGLGGSGGGGLRALGGRIEVGISAVLDLEGGGTRIPTEVGATIDAGGGQGIGFHAGRLGEVVNQTLAGGGIVLRRVGSGESAGGVVGSTLKGIPIEGAAFATGTEDIVCRRHQAGEDAQG